MRLEKSVEGVVSSRVRRCRIHGDSAPAAGSTVVGLRAEAGPLAKYLRLAWRLGFLGVGRRKNNNTSRFQHFHQKHKPQAKRAKATTLRFESALPRDFPLAQNTWLE
jgi:hypothetical protein